MEENIKPDDPYRLLARRIAIYYPLNDMKNLLRDKDVLLHMITTEINSQDMRGDFLDCILCELQTAGRKREITAHYRALGQWFLDNLDVPKLRRYIKEVCDSLDIPYN